MNHVDDAVLEGCRRALPGWRDLTTDDVDFDVPKGFSSFTMGVRPRRVVDPPAVLYRHLDGKENAILDFATERTTYLLLADHGVAARWYHYDETFRLEEFYSGRTLDAVDVFDPHTQRGIADELFRLHQLEPEGLPSATFFELLHDKWGTMARSLFDEHAEAFPPHERAMCDDLAEILSDRTIDKVLHCLPDRPPVFCHNDTYHGNIMRLDDGRIRLIDFEFSCRNHIAFDFANLFAETVMEHGLAEPPYFRIGKPRFTDDDIAALIGCYLDNIGFASPASRDAELRRLMGETRRALLLSDYMYAMAALPLSLEPIQRIRFIPYAHQRFHKFLRGWNAEFDR